MEGAIVCANAVSMRDCKEPCREWVSRSLRDRAEHPNMHATGSSAVSLLSVANGHNVSATHNDKRDSTTRSRSHSSLRLVSTALRIRRKNSTATPHRQWPSRRSVHNPRRRSILDPRSKGYGGKSNQCPCREPKMYAEDIKAVVQSRPADAQ